MEQGSMCAFTSQSETDVCLQQFVNPFCKEHKNGYFLPSPSISEIALRLRLKQQTNASFILLYRVFVQLKELNLCLDSES